MTKRWLVLTAVLIGAGPPRERVVTGDGVVEARVNGVPARVRVDPGALAMPIIGADVAARAKLHAPKLFSFGYAFHVGPTVIAGSTAVADLMLGGASLSRRVGWNARRYQADVDGVIGPGGLPEPVIRFQFRAPSPGERTATLPLVDDGGLIGGWGASYAGLTLGGASLRVRFAPRVARSYLGASVAVRVAAALGGWLDGAAGAEPIAFDVARPVRAMLLARPLVVGPLSLSRVGVRTAEGGDTGIPDASAPAVDPDEVVVTAKTRRKPRPGTLTLGGDALARCSSIVFDKSAKQVQLTCG